MTDVRLALGYTAVAIAAVTFYADHKLGWDATKQGTLWAVAAYFVLNSALTFWIWGVEKGKAFVGEGKNGVLLTIASSTQKYSPIYRLTVRVSQSRTAEPTTSEISCPFTRWFDADGYFVAAPFQQWLAREIPLIGAADPKSVEAAKKIREGFVELTDGDVKLPEKKDLRIEENGSGSEKSRKKIRERSRKNIKL